MPGQGSQPSRQEKPCPPPLLPCQPVVLGFMVMSEGDPSLSAVARRHGDPWQMLPWQASPASTEVPSRRAPTLPEPGDRLSLISLICSDPP